MKNKITAIFILSVLSGIMGPVRAVNQAELLLRNGKPTEAYQLLQNGKHTLDPQQTAYWKGRSLIALGRFVEAADALQQVQPEHTLYPYAARSLLYCAKHSPELSCSDVIEKLSHSQNEQIRALATAALAEQQLSSQDTSDGSPAFAVLQDMAKQNQKLQPIVKLLDLSLRRKMRNFDRAILYARELENDNTLGLVVRQLARLELAEIYYAQEKYAPVQDDSPIADTDDEPATMGMGEETLLQFITANPESPLLWTAFCRLSQHEQGQQSAYTKSKLNEWSEDTAHAHRAACALLLLMSEAASNGADTAPFANRAATDLPGEPLTHIILQEHIRLLLLRGDANQAELYTKLLESAPDASADVGTRFLRAMVVSQNSPDKAAKIFADCAKTAPDYLRIPALVNAMLCCMRSHDFKTANQLIQTTIDGPARRALLLAHAQMLPSHQAELAAAELREVLSMQPTPAQKVRAMLCSLRLCPPTDPLSHLCSAPEYSREHRSTWTDEDDLLYAAILEAAADRATQTNGRYTLDLLRKLCQEAVTPARKRALSLHLVDRLSQNGQHAEARDILLALAAEQPTREQKAVTLLYAGKECAACATLPSLQHASKLYAECARMDTPLTTLASIEQATILTRINRRAEALDILESLPREKLSSELSARHLSALADAYAAGDGVQSAQRALEVSSAILKIPKLPHAWSMRARLQHASQAIRAKLDAIALDDYLHVVHEHDLPTDVPSPSCVFYYYYAGAGAVYRLTCMNRFEEAAQLADHIAAWPNSTEPDSAPRYPERAKAFREWARAIRSAHFLPADILPSAQSPAQAN